jgi:hypothetical protein
VPLLTSFRQIGSVLFHDPSAGNVLRVIHTANGHGPWSDDTIKTCLTIVSRVRFEGMAPTMAVTHDCTGSKNVLSCGFDDRAVEKK